ncbi:COMM domain-containing protein [Balamuthia mandrillaris]
MSKVPRPSFEEQAQLRFPTLKKFEWRVDVAISTSSLNRMTLSDGTIRTFELSQEKFHELRFDVARLLKEMDEIEKLPIMKINK